MGQLLAKKFLPGLIMLASVQYVGDALNVELGWLPIKNYRSMVFKNMNENLKTFIGYYGAFVAVRTIVWTTLYAMAVPSWTPPDNIVMAFVIIGTGSATPAILSELKKLFGK